MHLQIFIGVLLIAALFLYQENRVNWFVKILWAYFIFLAIYPSYYQPWRADFMPDLQNVLGWNSTKNLFQILVFPAVILTMAPRTRFLTYKLLQVFVILDSIYLVYTKTGLIEANTFDCSVIACLVPIWLKREKQWWLSLLNFVTVILIAAAVVEIKSRTGALALGVIAATYGFYYVLSLKKLYFWGLGVSFIAFSYLGASFYFKTFMKDPRILMWAHYFDWWTAHVSPWIGTGLGGFEWVGLFIPSGFAEFKFYLMHNDWLQTLFESGALGLLALVVLYVYTACKLKKISSLAAWFAIGAVMSFYYPIHAFVIQMYGLMLMSEAHKKVK